MTRVLIVDDREDNLYYLSALLGAHGCEVESAHNGADALDQARRSPPGLVISDLLMPVMDGYSLLREWKADERLTHVPFIVYTATYKDPEDEQLARNLGADAFIVKPTEPDDLMARIRDVLARPPDRLAASGRLAIGQDDVLLREYNEALIRKLEHKTLQLEESNQRLGQDIALRRLAEVALRESEQRFRQLAESIDDVFWLTDRQTGEVVYVSPAYETVWGRDRASLLEHPEAWIESVHPGDRASVAEALAAQEGGTWDVTYRIVRPDQVIRWIRTRAYPVRDADGRVYRVAGVSRDITEFRRLEEQFRQAQKMEAIGRLASGVAHDFNNLLSVILSYTTLVLDELPPDSTVRGDIEEVRRAGERATDLTRQLLAFSRQQMSQPKVLDLGKVVLAMEKMLQRLLGEDIGITLRGSDASLTVHADPGQIEQIVMNLAINARDSMPGGGALTLETSRVEVSSENHPEAPPGDYVRLTVTDTGLGMDAPTRERIFEPFFTTKDVGKGTGLGLSTVFGIVAQSQGYIQVESAPGRGATFEVYLPHTSRERERASAAPPPPTTLLGSETILLVEDDAQVREMNRAILRRSGYTVLEAEHGDEALWVSERFGAGIQLLLTDVVMPRMNGQTLAKRLAETRPTMKVLYVSGYAEHAIAPHGVLNPGIAFLQKPVTPAALLRKVREVLADENVVSVALV